ncbi:MAG: hypothetical protein U0136_07140 [Bdellovibrionota bacterium]
MKRIVSLAFALLVLSVNIARAEDESSFVKLPLTEYTKLLEQIRLAEKAPDTSPAGYALGNATVNVSTRTISGKTTADVIVSLSVKVLEDKWTAVPLLPAGTSLKSATVNGSPIELLSTPQGLHWAVNKTGSYSLSFSYSVDALRSNGGSTLPLPLPHASGITFHASLPGLARDVLLLPSAGATIQATREGTQISATLPTGEGAQLSWRGAGDERSAMSRASYSGVMKGDAILWTGELSVELFDDASTDINLLPESATLSDVRVDGKPTSITLSDENDAGRMFTTRVQGKGTHTVTLEFQTAVQKDNGPSSVALSIPEVPVNKVVLTLPGKKEVTVTPASAVDRHEDKDNTVATIYAPMTTSLALQWTEAVPEEIKTEVRVNASIYHTAFAEEGVLFTRALAQLEVTRGETSLVEFEVPKDVQIGKVSSPQGVIADWRLQGSDGDKPSVLSVYFDRKVKGEVQLDITYDRSVPAKDKPGSFAIPVLRAKNVHRERGMIALLASKETTFKTVEENDLTRVGENQLPPEVRQAIDKTIAHSFKYAETTPKLVVELTKPEKQQGKFDAGVNTLVSLSDVTVRGRATVDVHVKSGTISDLELELPAQVNFLSLSAPSLRNHKLVDENGKQVINIEFTQDMEGEFRVEVAYEQIVQDANSDVSVPTIQVRGAEVEQGRIAVEALSAVEVLPAKAEQLSSLDPAELPQQLVLKTTNPILLAYKYAHVSPPYHLALRVKRHKEIEVQAATIDRADYQTLITKDGFAVTTAHFQVRNSRQQFLRVQLPVDSKVWLAMVDGRSEKPALAESEPESEKRPGVLIKIINSAQGFPVDLIYQTPMSELGRFGLLRATLPRPEIVVAETHWDLYLPQELTYGKPDSNMTLAAEKELVSQQVIENRVKLLAADAARGAVVEPLHITVPTVGVHYAFTKLYANQSTAESFVSLPYATGSGIWVGNLLLGFMALVFWSGALSFYRLRDGRSATVVVAATSVIGLMVGYLGFDYRPVVAGTAIAAITILVSSQNIRDRFRHRTSEASDSEQLTHVGEN